MARFSSSYCFLVLFNTFLVITVMSQEAAVSPTTPDATICPITLYPKDCNLLTCRADCGKKYNGNGFCSYDNLNQTYTCVCVQCKSP
ncbi:hypothetical protein ACHQM5_018187 [Ranunculus cassubicifolius]